MTAGFTIPQSVLGRADHVIEERGATRKKMTASNEGPREIESFQRFIIASIDHLVDALAGLTERDLNWHPHAPHTNSLYAIAVHVLANAEENILGTFCGETVTRDREGEFAAIGRSSLLVQEEWHAMRARISAALARMPPSALDRLHHHPRRGPLTGREVLLVVARHAAEHWGEAQLTRSLLRASSDTVDTRGPKNR